MALEIVPYNDAVHRAEVVALWNQVFNYNAAHNAPDFVIDKKLAVNDGLFFVAMSEGRVSGTIIAGYDGHRGWIYSLAVHPDFRNQGVASKLLSVAEESLTKRGCVKINLQVVEGNQDAQQFYEIHGYSVEKRISMGKRIAR